MINYRGDYETYLHAVNKEIEEGERETASRMSKAPREAWKVKAAARPSLRNEREIRKEMNNVEKTIARLDEQKKLTNTQFLSAVDPRNRCDSRRGPGTDRQLNEAEESASCRKNWASRSQQPCREDSIAAAGL